VEKSIVTYNFPEKPTREEAQAAVKAFEARDVEDLAWLVDTYLIRRGLHIPANYAPLISDFMDIWDDDFEDLVDDFSREAQIKIIRDVYSITADIIGEEIKRQHEKDAQIICKMRTVMIAGN
jgi:hypothetical protein